MSDKTPVQSQIIKNSEGNEFEAEDEVNSRTKRQVTTRNKAHLYPMVQQLTDLTKLNPNLTQEPYLWNWFNGEFPSTICFSLKVVFCWWVDVSKFIQQFLFWKSQLWQIFQQKMNTLEKIGNCEARG